MPIFDDAEIEAVKKPQDDRPLTDEQAEEWLKCAEDKYYWMENYVKVTTPKGLLPFVPRSYQKRILSMIMENRFSIAMSGRQSGKSQTLAVDVVHDLIFNKSYRVGMTSYTADNTQDLRDRVGEVYENLPMWMKPAVRVYNTRTIKFTNGSSVIFQVTGVKTFRGKSLHKIVIDEFAHVEEKVAEAFMTSLLPSITGGGTDADTKLVIISTPNGTSGEFARIWYGAQSNTNGYVYTLVEYEEIPNRGKEFEEQMLTKMSVNKFNQEYRCHMISDKGTLVNSRTIEDITTKDPVRSIGDLDIFVSDIKGRKLMMACDVSEGIGQDSHAFQIFDIDTLEQVAEYENNQLTQTGYTKTIIRTIGLMWKEGCADLYYTVENNGVGNGVLRLMENSSDEFLEKSMLVSANLKKTGIATTGSSKKEACAQFKDLCEMEKLKINSEKLKTQMKFFVKKGVTFKAENGTHDDLVMACIVMMNMMKLLADYEEDVYETVNEVSFDDDEDFADIYF
jgi:hypothetical protein